MAWGARGAGSGVDDWVKRLEAQDQSLISVHVFQFRRFGHEEVSAFCKALQNNTVLKELYASGHKMLPETARIVADMLTKNSALEALCVGDSEFGDEGVAELSIGLSKNNALTSLDLEAKSIGPQGAASLQNALQANTSLKTLQLARNAVGNEGLASLCKGLKPSSITSLDLSETGITGGGAAALGELLGSVPPAHIFRLILSNNSLGPEGGQAIAQGIAKNSMLEELNLHGCELGDVGAAALLQAVQQGCESDSCRLRLLVVSSCSIGPEGASLMANALSACTSLARLDLRENGVEETGVVELAKAIGTLAARNPGGGLLDLDLGGNAVGLQGVEALADSSSSLARLSLFNSGLGDAGAAALAKQFTLGGLPSLTELNLCGCEVGEAGMQAVLQALQDGHAPHLKVLEVGANPAVQADGWESLLSNVNGARPDLDIAWNINAPEDPNHQTS
ncbi:hypothetical protein CYMTET_13037 [Cymbomonas tetramitiformis]|uniref:Uncharacterized protein n=1 Tax=Cymbomonas tetramitiformis TaxID=36881 RepID=A0AAE0LBG4_9CHLO|nr:hypothetical protein CYMTET_13037 [Cymbomonas tetramitiformis]